MKYKHLVSYLSEKLKQCPASDLNVESNVEEVLSFILEEISKMPDHRNHYRKPGRIPMREVLYELSADARAISMGGPNAHNNDWN